MPPTEITDPELIKQYDSVFATPTPAPVGREITDPTEIEELNKAFVTPAPVGKEITDPDLIKQYSTAFATPGSDENPIVATFPEQDDRKRRIAAARNNLIGDFEAAGLGPGLRSSYSDAGMGLYKNDSGKWEIPQMGVPAGKDAGFGEKIGAGLALMTQTTMGKLGLRTDRFHDTIENVQKRYNLSDEDMRDVDNDMKAVMGDWGKDEKTRLTSDGKLLLNPEAREMLDPVAAKKLVEDSAASPQEKAQVLSTLPQRQTNIAANKLQAYEAAAEAAKFATGIAGKAGELMTPTEYAAKRGMSEAPLNTPQFVREYEQDVIDTQGETGAYIRGLAVDLMNGFTKVGNTALGLAGLAGSKSAGDTSSQIAEAQGLIQQGKTDTGLVGQIVQEVPSVITQAVAAQMTGGASMALANTERGAAMLGAMGLTAERGASVLGEAAAVGMAGAQSAGLTYAQERADGKSHEQAQKNAIISGINTGIITGIMSHMGHGGTEANVAGRNAADVTLRDLLQAGSKQELWASTRQYVKGVLKSFADEATEEGIDQFTQKFLTADPDTNLATVWKETWDAAMVGGVMGGGTHVLTNISGERPTTVPGQDGKPLPVAGPNDLPPPAGFTDPAEKAVNTLLTPDVSEAAPAAAEAARETAPASVVNAPTAELPTAETPLAAQANVPTDSLPDGQTPTSGDAGVPLTPTPQDNATGNREIESGNQPEYQPTGEGGQEAAPSSGDQSVQGGTQETQAGGGTKSLDPQALAQEFNLTPEQADYAVRIASALGLSPDTVLVGEQQATPARPLSDMREEVTRKIDEVKSEGGDTAPLEKILGGIEETERFQKPGGQDFYSQLSRTLEQKMPNASTPEQVMQIAKSGAKAEEVKWSGLEQVLPTLTDASGKVSREDVLRYLAEDGAVKFEEVKLESARMLKKDVDRQEELQRIRQTRRFTPDEVTELNAINQRLTTGSEDKTKYAQYTLPGGKNYREVVLAMPAKLKNPEFERVYKKDNGDYRVEFSDGQYVDVKGWVAKNEDQARTTAESTVQRKVAENNYTSSHFPDVPNYVAHMRLDERTDSQGKPGLFIEELQSDRHQSGRKQGYREGESNQARIAELSKQKADLSFKKDELRERIRRERNSDLIEEVNALSLRLNDITSEMNSLIRKNEKDADAIPDAPYRSTWPLALFKRALRDAVASSKDWIGWTNGDTQNERFDLSKQVQGVIVDRQSNGKYSIQVKPNGRNSYEVIQTGVMPDKVADYIGKDLASKLEDKDRNQFEGLDLKVGGSGMKGFYDTMLPKEIGKYVKQWGGTVEQSKLTDYDETMPREGLDAEGLTMYQFNQLPREKAAALVEKYAKGTPIWRINITPEMRESILSEGQTLFQGPKGSAKLTPEGKALIKGLTNPDFTTAVHEMMHAVEMTGFTVLDDNEVAALKAWAGSKTDGRDMMEKPASEKLARAWEKYLATGKAPLQRLQAMFDKIAKWMHDTYKSIAGSDIDVDISPEVQAIFDKIAARIESPAVVWSQDGESALHNENGDPLPPAIPPNPGAITDDMSDEEAEKTYIGMVRHAMENPPPAPPDVELPPAPQDENLYSLQNSVAQKEAAKYGIPVEDWKQAAQTFGDLWENAVKGGQQAATELIAELTNSPARELSAQEIAILTHEGLRRKAEVDRAIAAMETPAAKGNPALMKSYETIYGEAWQAYKELQNLAAQARTASGRSLNAWKYALRDDFSFASLSSKALASYNAALVAQGKTPVGDLPAEERAKIRKWAEKLQDLQNQARQMREAYEADREGFEQRIREQEAMIESLMAERKADGKRTAVADLTKRMLVDRVRKAAAEARARLKAENAIKEDPTERFQSAPNSENDPRWYDRVLVLAEPVITRPAMTAAEFADLVRKFFGEKFAAVADILRKDVDAHIRSTTEDITGKHVPTPAEVMESAPEEVTKELVYELARAHIYEGARKTEVMDKVHATLTEQFPEITRDEVSQLFTDYGRQTQLSKNELAVALREARALELVQKQIDDLESRGQMKRTGTQKDEPSPELRQLRKKRDDLAKKIGYSPVDPETGLSSAQNAARKRMEHEMEELQAAIDSGKPRIRVTRGVTYTEDMNVLREKLQALREQHERIFGQERTPEERAALILKDLDRRIEQERKLISEGLLKQASTTTPFADTPDIAARREQLKQLRLRKFEMWDAAHPGERALAQAMKEAQDAVARREAILQNGLRETPARRQRGEGVNPNEALEALWMAADGADVLIRMIRNNRISTPAEQQKILDRAYQAAIETREALREKIANGDLSVAPKSQREIEARTRAIREESAALRKQLQQMQKDAGVGPFSQEAKESRKVASLEKRIAELRRKQTERDYAEKAKTEPVTSDTIRRLEAEVAIQQQKFDNERAEFVFKQMKWPQKAWGQFLALYQARMMMNLTGDFGIFERQLGKVNFYVLAHDAWNYLTRKKPDIKESSVYKVLSGGVKSFMEERAPADIYHYYQTHPEFPFMRANGFQLVNPHETSFELTSDGTVRVNPLNVISDRLMASLMIGKGLLKMGVGMIPGMPSSSFAGALADTLKNVAIAVAGRRYAIRVERAQNAMLNIARWETAMLALNRLGPIDHKANPKFASDVLKGVMMSSGKIAGKGPIASFLREKAYPLSFLFAFLQHRASNFQATFQLPFVAAKLAFNEQTRPQAKVLGEMMAARYTGQAIKTLLASLLFGTWWDDEKEKKKLGVVLNPYHPKFGQLKVGANTYLDFNSGSSVWITDMIKMFSNVKLDPKMLPYGVERKVASTPFDKKKAFEAFTEKILNPNVQTLLQAAVFGQYRQGGPLARQSFVSQMDLLANELVMNLTARDFEKIVENSTPAEAAALFSLLMIGDQVNVEETLQQKAQRKAEERRRLTIPPKVIIPSE